MWVVTFAVQGSGAFPYDMLRFSTCFPHYQEDASKLYSRSERTVHLRRYAKTAGEAKAGIFPDRWKSFGWKVVGTDKPTRLQG